MGPFTPLFAKRRRQTWRSTSPALRYNPPMKWNLARLLVACLIALSAAAQQHFPEDVLAAARSITPREIQSHVTFLADDLLEGRDTGSRGHEIAARYVATRLMDAGVEPAGTDGSWYQQVPLRKATLDRATMEILNGDRWVPLEWKDEFTVVADPERTDSSVEAAVVFAGFGVTAPDLGWDDYRDIDVRDKLVIVLRKAPGSFPNDQFAHYSSTDEKRRNAAAHGAAGLIELSTPAQEELTSWSTLAGYADHPTMRWLDGAGEIHDGIFGLGVHARVSRDAAAKIFAGSPTPMDTIFTRADQGKPTGSFDLPVKVRVRTKTRHEQIESPNVVGMIRGSDPDLRDQFVLLVAHLDHVGRVGNDIYNGAYDNASGVAAMLAVAEAIAGLEVPPARSIGFLAVTAEEKGLLGAEYFANNPTEPVKETVAAISLDMFLMLYPLRDVVAFGAEHSTLGGSVEAAATELGLTLSPDYAPEEVLFIRTDHYPFVKRGVPALYLDHGRDAGDPAIDGEALVREWMKTTYHKPGDDMSQHFDWGAGADFARLNLLLAWQIGSDPDKPRWNEGSFFGELYAGDR